MTKAATAAAHTSVNPNSICSFENSHLRRVIDWVQTRVAVPDSNSRPMNVAPQNTPISNGTTTVMSTTVLKPWYPSEDAATTGPGAACVEEVGKMTTGDPYRHRERGEQDGRDHNLQAVLPPEEPGHAGSPSAIGSSARSAPQPR